MVKHGNTLIPTRTRIVCFHVEEEEFVLRFKVSIKSVWHFDINYNENCARWLAIGIILIEKNLSFCIERQGREEVECVKGKEEERRLSEEAGREIMESVNFKYP